jgi:GDSL-like Lipase/Acylhydrolase
VEELSQMLGLGTMSPFLAPSGGTNFAFGGAQTGPTDNNPFDPNSPVHIDLPDQVSAFNLVDPNPVKGALYTLDISANDIMNALSEVANLNTAARSTQQYLRTRCLGAQRATSTPR